VVLRCGSPLYCCPPKARGTTTLYNADIRTSSRSKTPWDLLKDSELDPLQKYLKLKYHEHFDQRHVRLSETDEAEFLNRIPVTCCHRCGSINFTHYGSVWGLNRYYCNNCHRTFVITTGTMFANHKLSIEEWIEYCLSIFGYGSATLISKTNKNSVTTSRYWLVKIFELLHDYQDDIVLNGTVYIDETFYKKRRPDVQSRTDGKFYRGLSKNLECIFTAVDVHGDVCALVNGTGKPSQERCWSTLGRHIGPGSHLIHDKERSHKILVKKLKLSEEVYDSQEIRALPDEDDPLQPINDVHNSIHKFLDSHSGFDRAYLQDYLNLFAFIDNGHKDPLERVYELINMGLTHPMNLPYREVFKPKHQY